MKCVASQRVWVSGFESSCPRNRLFAVPEKALGKAKLAS
jgi:hypothetical protein